MWSNSAERGEKMDSSRLLPEYFMIRHHMQKREKQTAGDCLAVGYGDFRASSSSFPQLPVQLKYENTKCCVLDQDIAHY